MTQDHLVMECDFEKASMTGIKSGSSNATLAPGKIYKALNIRIEALFCEETAHHFAVESVLQIIR